MGKSVGNMSLIERVGQMFIVGIDGTEPNDLIMELIQTYKIGGIMLYENNVESVEQLLRLINFLKSLNLGNELPLFIAMEHENGRANVLPKEIVKLPAIKYIADNADKNLLYETANMTGKVMRKLGINMNFWPLLDLGGMKDGKQLGDRCITNNPTIVSSYGINMINGMKDAGIIPVPKYFPGHGTTKANSDFIIPHTRKSIAKLEQADLIPFKNAIENGIDTMLIGHINLSRLNLFAPASMSYKVVTKLLKEKYGFKGISIADDITINCVDVQYGTKKGARKAVLAGNDVIILRDPKRAKNVLDDIAKHIKLGNIDSIEINSRVQKIIELKEKYGLKDAEITRFELKEINEELQAFQNKVRK